VMMIIYGVRVFSSFFLPIFFRVFGVLFIFVSSYTIFLLEPCTT